MDREKRYGAFLILAAVFLSVFFIRSTKSLSSAPVKTSLPSAPERIEPREQAASIQDPDATAGKPVNTDAEKPVNLAKRVKKADKAAIFPGFPIDINNASRDDLMVLPGIGEKTAQRILEKRAELGEFKSVDDLMEVKWIGKAKLEKIRDLVTVKKPSSKEG